MTLVKESAIVKPGDFETLCIVYILRIKERGVQTYKRQMYARGRALEQTEAGRKPRNENERVGEGWM